MFDQYKKFTLVSLFALLTCLQAQSPIIKTCMIPNSLEAPFAHAPTLIEVTPHHLMASFYAASDWGNKDQKIYISHYINEEWSAPEEIASSTDVKFVMPSSLAHLFPPPVTQTPCWDPVLFKAPDNSLLLFFKIGPDPRSWSGALKRSFDEGQTWTSIELLAQKGIIGPHKNKPVSLPDGSIVCACARGSWQSWTTWVEILKNVNQANEQWQLIGPLSYQDAVVGILQPTIFFDRENNLRMIFRTKNHTNLCTSLSSDHGLTWSPVSPITLTSNDSNSDAVTLNDKRILLAYSNLKPGKRYQLDLACSDDGGQTWRNVLVIEKRNNENEHVSFPTIIQTNDGLVHILYAYLQKQIKHVIVDPKLIL